MVKKFLIILVTLLFVFNYGKGEESAKKLFENKIIDSVVYEKIKGNKFLFYTDSHNFMNWSLIVPEGNGYIIFSASGPADCESNLEMNECGTPILTDTIAEECPLIEWGLETWENKNKELEGRLSLSGVDPLGEIRLYSQSGDRIIKYGSKIVYRRGTPSSILANLRYLMAWYAACKEVRQVWRLPSCEIHGE